MLIINGMGQLSEDVPPLVRKAVDACVATVEKTDATFSWGRTPGLAMLFEHTSAGRLDIRVAELVDEEDGAYSTVELVQAKLQGYIPVRPGHSRLGVGVLTECMTLCDGVEAPTTSLPDKLEEQIADLVAAGQLMQHRMVVAAFASGWRVEVSLSRHGAALVGRLFPPDEHEEMHDLDAVVTQACRAICG